MRAIKFWIEMIEKSNFIEITILVENFDRITVYEDNRNGLRGHRVIFLK